MHLSSSSGLPDNYNVGFRPIEAVHPDVLRSRILSRIDGLTLATLACVSSHLRSLCTDETLWREICRATWMSTEHPRVRRVISTLPAGHRSFFSDSYPLPQLHRRPRGRHLRPSPSVGSRELISAVDLYFGGETIFSRVRETETGTEWFLFWPFRVDLLDPKESASTRIKSSFKVPDDETWKRDLEENLRLSWILLDPTRKRSVNVSSRKPISVQRHWLTGEVHVKFSTVLAGSRYGSSETEMVEFAAVVVLVSGSGEKEERVEVSEVGLWTEDMEGKRLNGKESLGILWDAMDGERKRGREEDGKESYSEFVKKRREREERKRRRERYLETACLAGGVVALIFGFSASLCFIFKLGVYGVGLI